MNSVHVGCHDAGVGQSIGCTSEIFRAHDDGALVSGHPSITCIYDDHFRAVLSPYQPQEFDL